MTGPGGDDGAGGAGTGLGVSQFFLARGMLVMVCVTVPALTVKALLPPPDQLTR